ncbi:hypothetical protein B0W48_12960 [Pseudoalteromonas aliena]|uniref:YagK/YfjJ C-terminal domain-containing protein n=1 Tax=Pseudoalteromonas aliena TaxID=247523 RepID=A0A1Q2GZU6_9GAMM|nr:inovirus-type Gp2 protein [Pseudoalteromonas aliena]AQQ00636.1 hypothetical protein B0W48_12960 [Pseudoalteromonas aliena]
MASQLVENLKEKYGVEIYYHKASEESYVAFEIMNFEDGYYNEIVESTIKQLDTMLCYFSKVLVLRLDLRLKSYSANNKVMSQFSSCMLQKIKKIYGKVAYIWVREKAKASQQHYHIAYFLNGHKIAYPSKLIDLLKVIWERVSGGGSLSAIKNCFYQLSTNQEDFYETFKEVLYRLSYLAKCYSKRRVSQSVKNYSSSRLEYMEGS